MGMTIDMLFSGLDSVVWYNGFGEDLIKLYKQIKRFNYEQFMRKDINSDIKNDEQFEVIWIIMVHNFGDYGTSPRGGWLYMKNKEDILYFLEKITDTHRENEFISLETM